jgi:hypothetical protein
MRGVIRLLGAAFGFGWWTVFGFAIVLAGIAYMRWRQGR